MPYGENEPHSPGFSGGEIRMGAPMGGLNPGTPVGYRMLVSKADDYRCGMEARCERMEPLLFLLRQLEELGYEFVRLERIYGG
jgi:hypothetical protein